MCVVSMVGDFYQDKWTQPYYIQTVTNWPEVSKAEFEALKREVMEMKELLKRALKYDQENGEPDCQIDDKVALLKKMAELVGVDLNELTDNRTSSISAPNGTTWKVTQ